MRMSQGYAPKEVTKEVELKVSNAFCAKGNATLADHCIPL